MHSHEKAIANLEADYSRKIDALQAELNEAKSSSARDSKKSHTNIRTPSPLLAKRT